MNGNDTTEDMEKMLEGLLHAGEASYEAYRAWDRETVSLLDQVKLPSLLPHRVYTWDASDPNRVCYVGTDMEKEFGKHPTKIIGERCEVAMLDSGANTYKWMGWEQIERPRNVSPGFGRKVAYWYLAHMRHFHVGGRATYNRMILALDSQGQSVPFFINGQRAYSPENHKTVRQTFGIAVSIVLDARRANTFLVSMTDVKEDMTLRFPIAEKGVQSLLALRDDPRLANGRRKAILHWVSAHLRAIPGTNREVFTTVREHLRGVTECEMGGFRFHITPNQHGADDHWTKQVNFFNAAAALYKPELLKVPK